jgi:hypothetical protein
MCYLHGSQFLKSRISLRKRTQIGKGGVDAGGAKTSTKVQLILNPREPARKPLSDESLGVPGNWYFYGSITDWSNLIEPWTCRYSPNSRARWLSTASY